MIAYCSQFSQLFTGKSMFLHSSSFKKLKWHRTIYFHNNVIGFSTFIRITKKGSNLGVNLIPQFHISFGTCISELLVEEKLRMTARLKIKLVWKGHDICLTCCPPPYSGLLGNNGEFSQQC